MDKEKEIEGKTTVTFRPVCDCCGYVFSHYDNLHVEYLREMGGTREAQFLMRFPFVYPRRCPCCNKQIDYILGEGELFMQLVNENKKYNNDNK